MTERTPELVVVPDPTRLARVAVERFTKIAEEAVARSRRFTVALAGGSTPRGLYSLLATEPYRSRLPWQEIHVFWGDERCVPPEHVESNYGTAYETWLRHLSIPLEQIHRMRGEDPDRDRAAAEYEQMLRDVFGLTAGVLPRFDLILLGMGPDGHTASLFPGSPVLREGRHLVVAPYVERLGGYRLTLTLPVLNAAAAILFLVSGHDKAPMLRRVLTGAGGNDPLPAQLISPRHGTVTWLVDSAAASLLERSTPKGNLL